MSTAAWVCGGVSIADSVDVTVTGRLDFFVDAEKLDIWTAIAQLGHSRHRKKWYSITDEVKARIDRGEAPNQGREPPLILAASMGHEQLVKLLLDCGAQVDCGRKYLTPLLCSVNYPEVQTLLKNHGASESFFNRVVSGQSGEVQSLLQEEPGLVSIVDERGMTPLFHAIGASDVNTTQALLTAGSIQTLSPGNHRRSDRYIWRAGVIFPRAHF